MKYWKKQQVSTYVVGTSLIGVWGEPPHAWANYCWIAKKGASRGEQFKVLNMWAENIEAAVKQFNIGDTMEALVYQNAAIIIDSRIPLDWRYDKLCFTGGSGINDASDPIDEVMGEAYEYLGDKNNEVEQFTNPILYYARRGQVYQASIYTINGKEFKSGTIMMGKDAKEQSKKILEEHGIG